MKIYDRIIESNSIKSNEISQNYRIKWNFIIIQYLANIFQGRIEYELIYSL